MISVTLMLIVPGGVVGCNPKGNQWLFSDCSSSMILYMIHTVATMQTASIVRNVFIKIINDTKNNEDYKVIEE